VAATPFLGIAKGAMRYPPEFTNKARAAVEAAIIRAGRLYDEKSRQWKSNRSFPERQNLATCILTIFLAYARAAIELGTNGIWSVDNVRQQSLEGLRLITIEVSFKRGYHLFIESGGGDIESKTLREFEATSEWRQFEDELLALATRQALGDVEPGSPTAKLETDDGSTYGSNPGPPVLTVTQGQRLADAGKALDSALDAHEQMRGIVVPGEWRRPGATSPNQIEEAWAKHFASIEARRGCSTLRVSRVPPYRPRCCISSRRS
jgi:hypothetical protein